MTTLDILKTTYAMLPTAHKRQLVWVGTIMLVVGFFEIALAGVISLLGVALASPESLQTLPVLGNFFSSLSSQSTTSPIIVMLITVLCLVAVATALKNMGTAYMTYAQTKIAQTISWDVGLHTFKAYLHAPYIWYTQQNLGELGGYLSWRTYIANFWMAALSSITQVSIMLFLTLSAFIIAPLPSLLLFGVCGGLALLIYKLTQKKVRGLGDVNAQKNVLASKVTHYALQGMREVQIYNQREPFYSEYEQYAEPLTINMAKQSVYPPLPQWILESTGIFLLLCTVLLLQWQGKSVAAITGTLTLLAGISWRLLPAINKFVGSALQLKASFSPAQKLLQKLTQIPTEKEQSKAMPFEHVLELENIGFTYPNAKKKALANISLNIKKGSMVGLVGLSGAGKSTLVGVLTGLLPPDEGTFKVDGLTAVPSPGFLSIGYVPQAPYIMDASLAQNVAFADWGKAIDEERVLECCRMAAITFLEELPQGIHTTLGDRGIRLSGGQIQRVAIARALYNKPNILLFDEATSALDGAAEASIQKTILSLRENLTIVIVAHRLSTVEGCDEVYWLHEGEIRQAGDDGKALDEYKKFLDEQEK